MRISRLFEIVYILVEKKHTTAVELARRLEVSKRTILRDIDCLKQAGVPIYTASGYAGGIGIMDDYVMNKAVLTSEEQSQILLGLQSLASTRQVDTKAIQARLSALFGKADTSWIEVDFSRWGAVEPDRQKFETLRQAIINKQAISFIYHSQAGQTAPREVHPLRLIYKSNAWYIQAFCLMRRDYRTFKIHRMLQVEALKVSFASQTYSPPPLQPEQPPSTALVSLVLQFDPDVAYRVFDEFDNSCVEESEGSLIVRADLPYDGWLVGFLASFGASIQVIEPPEMRESLRLHAKAILESQP
jgi:predicted DNA-binding transcriptional regulator YafY